MMDKRIAITGLGVLSAIGVGKEAFSNALKNGVERATQSSFTDDPENDSANNNYTDYGIGAFDHKKILGDIKSRYMDRSTLLGLCAMQTAFEDGDFDEEAQMNTGLVIGSNFGSISSIAGFTEKAFSGSGIKRLSPMQFPNTVLNSPAGQINIKFKQTLLSSTVSTGFTSSLDAVDYAVNHIQTDLLSRIAVGGIEELSQQEFFGFKKLGCLGKSGRSIPFDKSSRGISLGEAAAILVLERLPDAQARGGEIYAEVSGLGTAFDSTGQNRPNYSGRGAEKAIRKALSNAGMEPGQIDYVSANANGNPHLDRMELATLKRVFKGSLNNIHISSVKSHVGECYGASGAIQIAAALVSLLNGFIPPNLGFDKSWDHELDGRIPTAKITKEVNNVLINNFSPDGSNACLVLSRAR